jgi:DNA-binding NtrC family response regulator
MSPTSKILIVDDNTRLCNSLKVFLSNQNSEIITAHSGKEAIDLLSKDKFDLILLDVVMPDMSGYQVMDYMHSNDLDTSVIVMTGYAPSDLAADVPPRGACAYLLKPFDLEELVTTVENALKKNT